jgi:hypothetical protein
MNKYSRLTSAIFSIFGSDEWKLNVIPTYPTNYNRITSENYIVVSIIPANTGINLDSVSGVLNIDMFIKAGNGPVRIDTFSDALDAYLVGNSKDSTDNAVVQFGNSSIKPLGLDKDNPTLYRALYTIPFNFYALGV